MHGHLSLNNQLAVVGAVFMCAYWDYTVYNAGNMIRITSQGLLFNVLQYIVISYLFFTLDCTQPAQIHYK